jgi:hypothetical protein
LVTLANVQQASLTGGPSNNTFDISGWSGTATINGNGGAGDTLLGPNVANVWNIMTPNAGTIVNANGSSTFTAIQNLTGGSSTNSFKFSNGASVAGMISGGSGSGPNTLDYTLYNTPVSINLQTSTATGTGGFSNIQAAIGGTASNTLTASSINNTWTLTGSNAGNINNTFTFTNFGNLAGGALNDTFNFANGAGVSGTVNGAAGSNAFSYASYSTPVTVDLSKNTATGTSGIASIQTFTGGSANDTLAGPNATNIWSLLANDTGTLNGSAITFTSFETLSGGTGVDTFTVAPSSTQTYTINGNLPGAGSVPGDMLNLNLSGVTGASLTPGAVGSGTWTFSNRMPVNFTGIEFLGNSPSNLVLNLSASAVNEGSAATLSGQFSTSDTGVAQLVTIVWGDGSAPTTLTLAPGVVTFGVSHVFANNLPVGNPSGLATIIVTVTDTVTNLGTTATRNLVVNNLPPTLSNVTIPPVSLGLRTFLSGNISDPGPLDTFTLVISWGDGSSQTLSLPAGTKSFRVPHVYRTGGTLPVVVTVFDDDNAKATASTTVHVSNIYAVGTDAGPVATVNVFDGTSGTLLYSLQPYGPTFTGGVRVAVGDVNGDGTLDIITGAGPGGLAQVNVYDGRTGQLMAGPLSSFLALSPTSGTAPATGTNTPSTPMGTVATVINFTGGIFVAAGDVNGDGFSDIIVGADAGGSPQVQVFSGADGSLLSSFLAFPAFFTGGVRVAAGDVNGDGRAEIIAGAGRGGSPVVGVFDGGGNLLDAYFALPSFFHGGIYVAAGDVNGDGLADVIVGAGPGGTPLVAVYDAGTPNLMVAFNAYIPTFAGGVRVAARDFNGDGRADITTTTGPGGLALVQTFDGATMASLGAFFAYDARVTGGTFVGV